MSIEHQPLALCVAITGLRLGELLALRWLNIDFASRRLSITHSLWRGRLVSPKTEASKRTLHLPDALAGILQAYSSRSRWDKPEDFVFCSDQGKPLDPDHLRKCVLYPAMRAVGIEPGDRTHGFHMFRHSAATPKLQSSNCTRSPLALHSTFQTSEAAAREGT